LEEQKMKRYVLLACIGLLLALAIGCGAQTGNVFGRVNDGLGSTAPSAPPALPGAYESSDTANQGKAGGAPGENPLPSQAQDEARMIVYTGSVSLLVNDTNDTVNKINDVLKNVNGYIASRSLVAYGEDKLRGTISVRIPAAALDSTLAQIKALGVKVLKEDQASNDVTEEYTDLDARRKNLEAYEVELQKLLETVRERTGKAEDILAVYNQLTEVRGQIEQIKGRQKYLETTSALATYTIELVPIEEVVVEGTPGWDPGRTAREALDNLVSTMQGLGDVAITVSLFVLPVLLVILLPFAIAFWVVRALLKRRAAPKAAVAK
jgi:hypothetical protein